MSGLIHSASASGQNPQTTQFTQYTPTGLLQTEIKPNHNTLASTYFADGLLRHQLETTQAGATVAEHTYGYNSDGVKNSDTETLMNADNGPALTHTLTYSFDPRDRLTQVTKDGTTTEQYTHDATDNVTSQTINGTTTSFGYDRDRLMSANGGAVTYNYDPLGRLDTVTNPTTNPPTTLETNTYDGFDNITAHQRRLRCRRQRGAMAVLRPGPRDLQLHLLRAVPTPDGLRQM